MLARPARRSRFEAAAPRLVGDDRRSSHVFGLESVPRSAISSARQTVGGTADAATSGARSQARCSAQGGDSRGGQLRARLLPGEDAGRSRVDAGGARAPRRRRPRRRPPSGAGTPPAASPARGSRRPSVRRRRRRSRRTRSTGRWRRSARRSRRCSPFASCPPCGAITRSSAPSASSALRSVAIPSRSAPGPATTPTIRPAIGKGVGLICRRAGDCMRGLRRLDLLRHRQAEAGGDLRAQVGVDAGQHGERPLLDALLVALAELEGVRVGDVLLLDGGQARVEQRRLGVVVGERRRRLADDVAVDVPRARARSRPRPSPTGTGRRRRRCSACRAPARCGRRAGGSRRGCCRSPGRAAG